MNLGGKQSLEVFFGYDDVVAFKRGIESFISACDRQNVLANMRIPAADAESAKTVLSCIQDKRNTIFIDKSSVALTVDKMFGNLPTATRDRIAQALLKEFSVLTQKKAAGYCNDTILKNAFVRVLYALKTAFFGLLENTHGNSTMFYEGDLNKYDFMTLNILVLLGIGGKVVCLRRDVPEFLTTPLFTVIKGSRDAKIDFTTNNAPALGKADAIQRNAGFSLALGDEIEAALDLLLNYMDRRAFDLSGGCSPFLSLNFCGMANRDTYTLAINKFYLALKAKRDVYVLDASFGNPTFEEVQEFTAKGFAVKSINELLDQYALLKGAVFPALVWKAVDAVLAKKAKKGNAETVIKIWLTRIGGIFNVTGKSAPVIIVWGALSDKVFEFLVYLEHLPADIIQFSPAGEPAFSTNAKSFDVGKASSDKLDFPYEASKLSEVKTVAFQAEQEIRNVLGGDDTLYYQMRQFKAMNPIILKTTFEEIDIIWKEPAKFRPSFSTAGNVVTIPSIFAKINGTPDSLEDYIAGIQAKITPQTLLLNKFPYMPPEINPDATVFMKRVFYNNVIDAGKMKSSRYYQYGLFSQETQNVVIKGINDFVNNDWYIKKRSSFVYDVLEILFRMPQNVIQLIHNFSFTETIPKVIVFNPTNVPCEAADCILIMFLKSLGFDVIMYVPTGYRIVEEYISENLFNNIEIGQYRYDLAELDITRRFSERKGIFKSILNRKGTR